MIPESRIALLWEQVKLLSLMSGTSFYHSRAAGGMTQALVQKTQWIQSHSPSQQSRSHSIITGKAHPVMKTACLGSISKSFPNLFTPDVDFKFWSQTPSYFHRLQCQLKVNRISCLPRRWLILPLELSIKMMIVKMKCLPLAPKFKIFHRLY